MTAVVSSVLALACAIRIEAAPKAAPDGYAEGVYAEYSAAAGRSVLFSVRSVAAGTLAELSGAPLADVVGLPAYVVEAVQAGLDIRRPRYAPADSRTMDLSELEATVEGFEQVGYPLALGRYRRLLVTVAIGADLRTHQALEFCWASLGRCAVLDPSVAFLQSMVDNRRRLAAEGWGPRLMYVPREAGDPDAPGAVCGLASNPSVKDRYYYWRAYWVEYKNVFGMVLVRKDLGAQKSGIRCDVNCNPQPYGYSNVSSGYGTLGWNAACDNDFGYGASGGTGKWIAETKCTHKWVGSATANASVSNIGSLSVSIAWNVDGGIDQNGGQIIDTCGYY
jgi:hypothetical protein